MSAHAPITSPSRAAAEDPQLQQCHDDIERLTRRLRSVSQRLEGIEDGVERLDDRLAEVSAASDTAERLRRVEELLTALTAEVQALAGRLPDESEPVSRDQERLEVSSEG